MARKKYYVGSTGPFFYDDDKEINDPDFADRFQAAINTEGRLKIGEAPAEDDDVVRKGDLTTLTSDTMWKRKVYAQNESAATWLCPAPNTPYHVTVVGGGGGGAAAGSTAGNGTAGTQSSFGGHIGYGGVGGTGSATGIDLAIGSSTASATAAGGLGYNDGGKSSIQASVTASCYVMTRGMGGQGFMGFGAGGDGAPPAYNVTSIYMPGAGGGSGYVATYSGVTSDNQAVVVGTGGTGGTGTLNGTDGADGVVIVEWEEQL